MIPLDNFKNIYTKVSQLSKDATIIVVSKTFQMNIIEPLINYGHLHFGENRVNEAKDKWSSVLKKKKDLQLHFLGKLQTNKIKDIVQIFSFIHSLDSEKLANKLSAEEVNSNKKLKYFIQVNTGNEIQKSGVRVKESDDFINYCLNSLKLNVIGLMCLPPLEDDPRKHFTLLSDIAKKNNLKNLSMGMSNDYLIALSCGSNYLRIGSAIFGKRN
jgi:pyridoxal phosphate enzyme (YggS family)